MKKNNKKAIICIILIIVFGLYFSLIRGFYAFSDKCVGSYTGDITKSIRYFIDFDQLAIGENRYREPIFVYDDNAFQLASNKFSDIFDRAYDLYHEEYEISNINKHNLSTYKELIVQMSIDNQDKQDKKNLCIEFIDIYENSFKRWFYIPGVGWNRTIR